MYPGIVPIPFYSLLCNVPYRFRCLQRGQHLTAQGRAAHLSLPRCAPSTSPCLLSQLPGGTHSQSITRRPMLKYLCKTALVQSLPAELGRPECDWVPINSSLSYDLHLAYFSLLGMKLLFGWLCVRCQGKLSCPADWNPVELNCQGEWQRGWTRWGWAWRMALVVSKDDEPNPVCRTEQLCGFGQVAQHLWATVSSSVKWMSCSCPTLEAEERMRRLEEQSRCHWAWLSLDN